MSDFIKASFEKVVQSRSYTAMIISCDKKRFAIYSEPSTGKYIQKYASHDTSPRPETHDLISKILLSTNTKILKVVITDVDDTLFFSKIYLETTTHVDEKKLRHIIVLDARPSNSIVLALFNNAPIFCTHAVCQKAVPFID